MKKNYLLYFILIFCYKFIAQDTHFSQYYVAPQFINPAAFGVINKFEAGLTYKSQWSSFTKGYTSYSAFFNGRINNNKKKNYFSVGLNLQYDKSGDGNLTTLVGLFALNYSLKINSTHFISAGINGGINQKNISVQNLTWGNQFDGINYDPSLPSNEVIIPQSKTALDVGLGMAWVYKKKNSTFTDISNPKNIFGISASHINRPSYSFFSYGDEKMSIRYNLYEYYHFYFKDSRISIIPSLLIQYQAKATEFVLGAILRYKPNSDSKITGIKQSYAVSAGFFYRFEDAGVINLGLDYKRYSFGVAYDVNLSSLKTATKNKGGLEVYIKLNSNATYMYKGHSKY